MENDKESPESGLDPDLLAETAEKGIEASVVQLSAIYSFFNQYIAARSRDGDEARRVDLSCERFGVIPSLTAVDFRTDQSFSDAGSQVDFRFRLVRDLPIDIACPVSLNDDDIPLALRRDGVIVLSSRIRRGGAEHGVLSMEIAPDIPVGLTFRSVLGSSDIQLETRNIGTLGSRGFRFSSRRVGPEFFDSLEQLLRFDSLTLLDEFEEQSEASATLPSPQIEQTIQTETVSADILTFDLSRRARQKSLRLVYQGEEFIFNSEHPVCRLGRRMPADIQIRSRFVSREHATLILDNRQFSLRDHSSNGTYVRPEGRPTYMLHHASQKLEGVGVISLGEEISLSNPDLIYYEIRE